MAGRLEEQFAAALLGRGTRTVYVSHLKVYEYADGAGPSASRKTRFIIVAITPDHRHASLYKAKRNANASYSIGKEWDLTTLRKVVLEPDASVTIGMARSYRWQTEEGSDPTPFLNALAQTLQQVTGSYPECEGWQPPWKVEAEAPAQHAPTLAYQSPTPPRQAPPISIIPTRVAPPAPSAAPALAPAPALPAPVASPVPGLAPAASPQGVQRSPSQRVVSTPPSVAPASASPARVSQHASSSRPAHADTSPSALAPAAASRSPSRRGGLSRPAVALAPTAVEVAKARRGMSKDNATLTHVEEMLEGFEWKGGALSIALHDKARSVGTADVIENRLLEELSALESSGIHAMIESDDRIFQVLHSMDEAIEYLDQLEGNVAGYRRQLSTSAEDIAYIESQNRGLQVKTTNQRLLLHEIHTMLSTVQVDNRAIQQLSTASVEREGDVQELETAAASLYKSILQTRPDPDARTETAGLPAMTERLQQYEALADEFSTRLLQGVADIFERESGRQLSDPNAVRQTEPPNATLPHHDALEQATGKYCGLMLYMKETSPTLFDQLSEAYVGIAGKCYQTEIKRVFHAWRQQLHLENVSQRPGVRQASDPLPWEALQRIYAAFVRRVQHEQALLSDLLHINDTNVTFADYMGLDPHFRHRAAITTPIASGAASSAMRSALERVFGSFSGELDAFVGRVGEVDRLHVVGLLAETERVLRETAVRSNSDFYEHILRRAYAHMQAELTRWVDDQIRSIEQTKLTVKKRTGIVPFAQTFPALVQRMEAQLADADHLRVRTTVNDAYERIARTIFSMLQSISQLRVAGLDEDKSQLNHFVILVENMYHMQRGIQPGTPPNPALVHIRDQAHANYAQARDGYIQSVLRRSLGKMMDFSNGLEALLQSTPANEVTLHSAYSKSAAKKLVREYTAKDMRKAVEALSKRVQKHFVDDEDAHMAGTAMERDELAQVLADVWRCSEHGYAKQTERFASLLRTCYGDALHLEYPLQDARRQFQSNPPSLRKR